MSKRYNDHKKTPKPKENQQGILKMYALSQKIEQRASRPEERTVEVMYLSMIISIYLVVQQRPQLEHSSLEFMVATPTIRAKTSSSGIYCRKQPNQQAYLELRHRNPDIWERMLIRITFSNSTVGRCAPMNTTEDQKWSSFQTNYD